MLGEGALTDVAVVAAATHSGGAHEAPLLRGVFLLGGGDGVAGRGGRNV